MPSIFLGWAKSKMSLPDHLTSVALDSGVSLTGWRELHEALQQNYNEMNSKWQETLRSSAADHATAMNEMTVRHSKAMDEIAQQCVAQLQEAYAELTSANEELETLRAQQEKNQLGNPLKARERDSLRLIALLGALQGFGFDPDKNNSAASQISMKLARSMHQRRTNHWRL